MSARRSKATTRGGAEGATGVGAEGDVTNNSATMETRNKVEIESQSNSKNSISSHITVRQKKI